MSSCTSSRSVSNSKLDSSNWCGSAIDFNDWDILGALKNFDVARWAVISRNAKPALIGFHGGAPGYGFHELVPR